MTPTERKITLGVLRVCIGVFKVVGFVTQNVLVPAHEYLDRKDGK